MGAPECPICHGPCLEYEGFMIYDQQEDHEFNDRKALVIPAGGQDSTQHQSHMSAPILDPDGRCLLCAVSWRDKQLDRLHRAVSERTELLADLRLVEWLQEFQPDLIRRMDVILDA